MPTSKVYEIRLSSETLGLSEEHKVLPDTLGNEKQEKVTGNKMITNGRDSPDLFTFTLTH